MRRYVDHEIQISGCSLRIASKGAMELLELCGDPSTVCVYGDPEKPELVCLRVGKRGEREAFYELKARSGECALLLIYAIGVAIADVNHARPDAFVRNRGAIDEVERLFSGAGVTESDGGPAAAAAAGAAALPGATTPFTCGGGGGAGGSSDAAADTRDFVAANVMGDAAWGALTALVVASTHAVDGIPVVAAIATAVRATIRAVETVVACRKESASILRKLTRCYEALACLPTVSQKNARAEAAEQRY